MFVRVVSCVITSKAKISVFLFFTPHKLFPKKKNSVKILWGNSVKILWGFFGRSATSLVKAHSLVAALRQQSS